MNTLSLTQQYLLCTLGEKGKFPGLSIEKILCLSGAAVLELLMDETLAYDGKKLTVCAPLPAEKEFLRPVYTLVEKKQPVKFETVVEYFSVTLTDKNINELIDGIGASLVAAGCAAAGQGGLMGRRTVYLPDAGAVDAIVQNIRAEMLEDGPLSEEIVALSVLLAKSGDLARYFSPYEKKDFKRRLKEIREHPQNEMIRKVSEYIDSLFVMIIVAAT
jgi:hypothetical protein